MATFNLEIVTPKEMVYAGHVRHLQAPGSQGSFGILAGHVPLLSSLSIGAIRIDKDDGEFQLMSISGGVAQVSSQGVTILAETAEKASEIDVERARLAQERAEKRLRNEGKEDFDSIRAEAALGRALNRLKISDKA
tara:strand:- start:8 stop:415 length:408 start_codon:yes stop_codon:yes gene_type:complete